MLHRAARPRAAPAAPHPAPDGRRNTRARPAGAAAPKVARAALAQLGADVAASKRPRRSTAVYEGEDADELSDGADDGEDDLFEEGESGEDDVDDDDESDPLSKVDPAAADDESDTAAPPDDFDDEEDDALVVESDDDASDDENESLQTAVSRVSNADGKKRKKQVKTKVVVRVRKQSKQGWVDAWADPAKNVVTLAIDIETTSNRRKNFDLIIELAVVAYAKDGKELGRFVQRYSNCGVPIDSYAFKAHGISESDLRGKPTFADRAPALVSFFNTHLRSADIGVLVAHNGAACDFPFLCVAMARAGVTFPAKLMYTLDTYQQLKRFKGIEYHKQTAINWPQRTEKQKGPKLSASACVDFILRAREPMRQKYGLAASFATVCGAAHNACADSIGAHMILKDDPLWSRRSQGLCLPLADSVAKGALIASTPPVVHEDVPDEWEDITDDAANERVRSAIEPAVTAAEKTKVDEEIARAVQRSAPAFTPNRRNAPGPSKELRDELGGAVIANAATEPAALLLALFFFYFTEHLLKHIVDCTNAHATQQVIEVRALPRSQHIMHRSFDVSRHLLLSRLPRMRTVQCARRVQVSTSLPTRDRVARILNC